MESLLKNEALRWDRLNPSTLQKILRLTEPPAPQETPLLWSHILARRDDDWDDDDDNQWTPSAPPGPAPTPAPIPPLQTLQPTPISPTELPSPAPSQSNPLPSNPAPAAATTRPVPLSASNSTASSSPSSTPSLSPPPSSNPPLHPGAIAGIILSILALLILGTAGVFLHRRRQRARRTHTHRPEIVNMYAGSNYGMLGKRSPSVDSPTECGSGSGEELDGKQVNRRSELDGTGAETVVGGSRATSEGRTKLSVSELDAEKGGVPKGPVEMA